MNADLDMLPNIRFRVNDTQIRLVSTTIYKYAIVHLQKGVSRVVLYILEKIIWQTRRLTGECWPVVALFAKGITNNCPSRSERNFSVLRDNRSQILTLMHCSREKKELEISWTPKLQNRKVDCNHFVCYEKRARFRTPYMKTSRNLSLG
jgi:hypothetical protein